MNESIQEIITVPFMFFYIIYELGFQQIQKQLTGQCHFYGRVISTNQNENSFILDTINGKNENSVFSQDIPLPKNGETISGVKARFSSELKELYFPFDSENNQTLVPKLSSNYPACRGNVYAEIFPIIEYTFIFIILMSLTIYLIKLKRK